jgi:hypothetical protein
MRRRSRTDQLKRSVPWVRVVCSCVLAFFDCVALLFTSLAVVPTWAAQVCATFPLTLLANVVYMVLPIIAATLAPPQLFGKVFGVWFSSYGVLQLALIHATDALGAAAAPDSLRAQTVAELIAWMVFLLLFGTASFACLFRQGSGGVKLPQCCGGKVP